MKRKISDINSSSANNLVNSNNNNSSVQFQEDIIEMGVTTSKKINQGKEESIRTYCRIKPIENNPNIFKISENENKTLIVSGEGQSEDNNNNTKMFTNSNNNIVNNKPSVFNFSYIFDAASTQSDVFTATCLPLINDIFKLKKSGLIFAYGLTNAGKTYTVVGDPENPGVLPLSLKVIMSMIGEMDKEERPEVFCHFVEIYNEEIFDLLNFEKGKPKKKVNIKERDKLFFLQNVSSPKITSIEDFNVVLNTGVINKTHAATSLNQNSSRSHTIFRIILRFACNKIFQEEMEEVTLSIVDLAGSERAYRTETSGKELQQACKINQSLSVLGKCLDAMKYNSIYVSKKYVPFRESKLTMLFQEYFQGDQNIIMITNISPGKEDLDETLRVLTYSCIAKEIKPIKSKIITTNNFPSISKKLKHGKTSNSEASDYSEDESKEGHSISKLIKRSESLNSQANAINFNYKSINNVNNNNFQQEIDNLKVIIQDLYKNCEDQQDKYEQLEKKNEFLIQMCKDLTKRNEVQSFNQILSALETFSTNLLTSGISSFVNALSFRRQSEEKVKYILVNSNVGEEDNSRFKFSEISNIAVLQHNNSIINNKVSVPGEVIAGPKESVISNNIIISVNETESIIHNLNNTNIRQTEEKKSNNVAGDQEELSDNVEELTKKKKNTKKPKKPKGKSTKKKKEEIEDEIEKSIIPEIIKEVVEDDNRNEMDGSKDDMESDNDKTFNEAKNNKKGAKNNKNKKKAKTKKVK